MKVRVRAYPHEVYDVLEESTNFYVVSGPCLLNKSFCEVLHTELRWRDVTNEVSTDSSGDNLYLNGFNIGMHFRTSAGIRFRKVAWHNTAYGGIKCGFLVEQQEPHE